jgi:hypothetical protein
MPDGGLTHGAIGDPPETLLPIREATAVPAQIAKMLAMTIVNAASFDMASCLLSPAPITHYGTRHSVKSMLLLL